MSKIIAFSGILALLTVCCGVSPAYAQVFTLEQAFERALQNNPSVAVAKERINQAGEVVTQARAAYYPDLEAYGSVTRNRMSDAAWADAMSAEEKRYNTYATGLSASWTLFSGFERKYSNLSAHLEKRRQVLSLADLERSLCYSVADAYFDAQLAVRNRIISESDRAFNRRQLENAKAKHKVGTGSLSDILNFKTKVNAAALQIEEAVCSYNRARAVLASLMGFSRVGGTLPEPGALAPETPEEMEKPDIAEFIRQGLDNRPDIQGLACQVENAAAGVGTARADFYPSVSLNASVDAQSTESDMGTDEIANSVSLQLSYPIFSGGRTRAALAEAKHAEREARKELESLRSEVVSEIRQACFNVILAQNQLAIQRENVDIARQNRDLVRDEYEAGKASLVRLNEAQRDLITAREELAQSLVAMRQAWLELKTSAGLVF